MMQVGYGRSNNSGFSRANDIRRQKSIQRRKVDAARVKRQKAQTQKAIQNMQNTAGIFGIKSNQSYASIELVMKAAQDRAIKAAQAKGLGQNVNKVA